MFIIIIINIIVDVIIIIIWLQCDSHNLNKWNCVLNTWCCIYLFIYE